MVTPIEKKMKDFAGFELIEVTHYISQPDDYMYKSYDDYIIFDTLSETIKINCSTTIDILYLIIERTKELGWVQWRWDNCT